MKKLVTLAFLLCWSLSSFAQFRLPKTSSLPLVTHEDSVAFIRHVFKVERRSSRLQTISNGMVTAYVISELASSQRIGDAVWKKSLAIGTGAGMGYISFLDIQRWSRFSKRRAEEAVRRFELRQPQKPYIDQKLAAAFLHYNRNR